MATAPILAPDGSVRMIPQDMVDKAVAAGGKPVTKMQAPDKTLRWIPSDQVEAAEQSGGMLIPGMPSAIPAGLKDNAAFTGEGTAAAPGAAHRVIVPAEGETFQQTMQRAASAGKTVTPEQLQVQEGQAVQDAPKVLAAAPAIGAAGAGALAGAGELGTVAGSAGRAIAGQITTEGLKQLGKAALKKSAEKAVEGVIGGGTLYTLFKLFGKHAAGK